MRCSMFAVASLCVAATSLSAAEIRGQIGALDEQGVAVLVSGDFEPQPGDKFTVVVDVPNVGEASIAQGQVSAIDDGIVLGKIVSSTGKVAVGQKVKIDSPQAVQKRRLRIAVLSSVGRESFTCVSSLPQYGQRMRRQPPRISAPQRPVAYFGPP